MAVNSICTDSELFQDTYYSKGALEQTGELLRSTAVFLTALSINFKVTA